MKTLRLFLDILTHFFFWAGILAFLLLLWHYSPFSLPAAERLIFKVLDPFLHIVYMIYGKVYIPYHNMLDGDKLVDASLNILVMLFIGMFFIVQGTNMIARSIDEKLTAVGTLVEGKMQDIKETQATKAEEAKQLKRASIERGALMMLSMNYLAPLKHAENLVSDCFNIVQPIKVSYMDYEDYCAFIEFNSTNDAIEFSKLFTKKFRDATSPFMRRHPRPYFKCSFESLVDEHLVVKDFLMALHECGEKDQVLVGESAKKLMEQEKDNNPNIGYPRVSFLGTYTTLGPRTSASAFRLMM